MTLTTGSRLGPYEITAAIGAGGMGEVYRARDTQLGRDVAIKVLPSLKRTWTVEGRPPDEPSRLFVFTEHRADRRRHEIGGCQAKPSDLERNCRRDLQRVSLVGRFALKFMKILNTHAHLPLG